MLQQLAQQLSQMTLGEIVRDFLFITAVIFTVLEKLPKTISPWTKLLNYVGTLINGEVLKRLEALERRVEERHVIDARLRIIRFGDELLHDVHHSKDYFDQILLDITAYEQYCTVHPEFKNNVTSMTAERIKEVYHDCLKEHSFL